MSEKEVREIVICHANGHHYDIKCEERQAYSGPGWGGDWLDASKRAITFALGDQPDGAGKGKPKDILIRFEMGAEHE